MVNAFTSCESTFCFSALEFSMNRVFTSNPWGNPEVELKWVKYAIGTLRLGSILELIYQIWIIYPIENLILFRVQVLHISCLNFSWQNILLVKVFTQNANGVDSGQGRSSFRNFRPCISETNHRFRYKICYFVVSLQCYNYLIRSFDCNFTRSMS